MMLSAGQMNDQKGAAILHLLLPPARELIANRGDDSNPFRAARAERGITACIPPKQNRRQSLLARRSTASATASRSPTPASRTAPPPPSPGSGNGSRGWAMALTTGLFGTERSTRAPPRRHHQRPAHALRDPRRHQEGEGGASPHSA
jgi:hypothetical protein